MSVDILNNGPDGLVFVVPLTTARYGLRSHVEIEPGGNGLDRISFARCDQLRTVSVVRLTTRLGMIAPELMQDIDQALHFVLDL